MDLITFSKALTRGVPPGEYSGYWEVASRAITALAERDTVRATDILRQGAEPQTELENYANAVLGLRIACLSGDLTQAGVHVDFIKHHPLFSERIAQAVAEYRIGVYHRLRSELETSMSCQVRAAAVFRDHDWKLEEALCDIEIGSILLFRGDVSGAAHRYASALDVIKEYGSKVLYALALVNFTTALHRAGNVEEAFARYRELLDLAPFKEPGDARADVLHRFASLHKQVGELDTADELYAEGLACVAEKSESAIHAILLIGVADLAVRRGELETAEALISNVERIDTSLIPESVQLDIAGTKAHIVGASGDQSTAYQILLSASQKAAESGRIDEQQSLLSDALLWVSDPDLRKNILEEYRSVQDQRLQSVAKGVNSIIEIRSLYEQERARAEMDRQQELSRVIVDTQTRTSNDIGRELHDSIGQDLTVLHRLAQRISSESEIDPAEHARLVAIIAEVARRAATDARRIAHLLSGTGITGKGLADALSLLRQEIISAVQELDLQVIVTNSLDDMRAETARAVLRIIQTVLQNVVRHASARACSVNLVVHPDHYYLGIEDDGKGFDVASVNQGMGLREMKARAELIGGTVRIESTPGRGTYVEVTLPRDGGIAS